MTFLFQDNVGGLEVEDPNEKGTFTPIPYVHGTIVLNVGDFLQRWSNDVLKSTMHRIGAPPLTPATMGSHPNSEQTEQQSPSPRVIGSRYSMPYFIGANTDILVDCLPNCYGPERPKRYEPVWVRD